MAHGPNQAEIELFLLFPPEIGQFDDLSWRSLFSVPGGTVSIKRAQISSARGMRIWSEGELLGDKGFP